MCCMLSCCVWALDLIQRLLTLLLACILMTLVVIVLLVAIVTGIAYGYNYSIAEFLAFKKSDVTVYMRRGQFSDEAVFGDKDGPAFLVQRRGGDPEDLFPAGEAVDLKKVTPDAAGDARQLADLWEQTKDARKYNAILNKFNPRKKEKKVTKEPTRSYIGNIESLFIEQDSQDNILDTISKSNAMKTITTIRSPPTARRVKEIFRKVSSYNKKHHNQDSVQKKTTKPKKNTVRTINKSPSTERRVMKNFKPLYIEEENQDQYDFVNKTVKPETVKTKTTKNYKEPDLKIRIDDSINYDQYDLHKETVKSETVTTKTTKNLKDPDVKIRIDDDDINFDEKEKNKIIEQALGENENYKGSEEDRIVHDIQEESRRYYTADKAIKQNDKRKDPGVQIRVENYDADTSSEKTKNTENSRISSTGKSYKTRIPDIRVRVESEDNESDQDIQKAVVENKTENIRSRNIYAENRYKTRIPDINVRVESEYDKSDGDIKKSEGEPFENVEYEEQFDGRSSDPRYQNNYRFKFGEGATPHLYKAEQPPHLYREEDDEVMYKPV